MKIFAFLLCITAGMNFAQGQPTPQWRTTLFRGMTAVTPCVWEFGAKGKSYFGAGEVPERAYDLSAIVSYTVTDPAAAVDTASCPLYGLAMIMLGDTVLAWEPCPPGIAPDSANGRIEGKEFSGIFDMWDPCVTFRYRIYRHEPSHRQWEILVMYVDQAEEEMVADRIFNSIEFGEDAFGENEPAGND